MSRYVPPLLALALLTFAAYARGAETGTLLVLNKSHPTVSLLDLASRKAVTTIATGAGPHEVAVSPDGRTAVVTNYGDQGQPGNTLTVIDVPDRKAVKTISRRESPAARRRVAARK